MEFRLDDGQVELQQTVARFCADRFPLDAVADREGRPVDRAAWRELADLGVLGLLVEGSGLGLVEAALVFEQLGSHLVPGPLLWTVLAAPLVDGAGAGEVLVGGIDATADPVVEHPDDIDVLLVVDGDAIALHRTADLPAPGPLDPLDPLTPVGWFAGLPVGAPLAVDVTGTDIDVAQLRRRGTVLSAALLAGLAGRALEVARAYALERHQFGVPIGSFQAVQHLLADMFVEANLAQSAVYAAAALADDDTSAARAKLLAGEAAVGNARTAVQVLGGMGFTWEMLPHRLLKRAWVLEQGFGTTDDHALRLGATLSAVAS